jgi:hypothetical protein
MLGEGLDIPKIKIAALHVNPSEQPDSAAIYRFQIVAVQP